MSIIIGILFFALLICVGVIYEQHKTIVHQRKHLIEALDWIEPDALVREDWE